jgi:hypothetical protein
MGKLKWLARFIAAAIAILPIGCGTFNGHEKNPEGFYEEHFYSCGPKALEKALNSFWSKPHDGVIYCFIKPFDRKEISQLIQGKGMACKEALAFFHRDAICITWPSEIKYICEKYNVELIRVKDINNLDPKTDVAIILVHGKYFSREYHWVVYPLDNAKEFHGEDTVIDMIFLLKIKD